MVDNNNNTLQTGNTFEANHRDASSVPLLEVRGISKRFPGVLAVDNVSFAVNAGEVHVLFGENGAGKSTLISMLAGVYQPNDGEIIFRGNQVKLNSVHHARELGISVVFQEFSLVGQLTIEQNLFLGAEQGKYGLLNKRALHNQAQEILTNLGFPLKPTQRVDSLSRAQQQMVEIAKAFRSNLSVLILDEPTASLTEKETQQLFKLIETMTAQNVAVIYITHRMAEIKHIADRVTVLRDGRYIDTVDAKKTNEMELVKLMTGRVIDEIFPKITFAPGEEILSINNIYTANGSVQGASITAHKGEIVGLAGLVGTGKSRLLRACFGLEKIVSGNVIFDGEDVTGKSARNMLDRGFFYSPSDRRREGLLMMRNCRENITLPSLHLPEYKSFGLLRRSVENLSALELAQKFQLSPLKIERRAEQFSGGNQQKIMLAKCLIPPVKLFVFDEPTVGVDVGTRVEIYKFIGKLCEAGFAVIIISSDLPEVLHLSHRLYVMHQGAVQTELTGEDITEQNILHNFFDKEVA